MHQIKYTDEAMVLLCINEFYEPFCIVLCHEIVFYVFNIVYKPSDIANKMCHVIKIFFKCSKTYMLPYSATI